MGNDTDNDDARTHLAGQALAGLLARGQLNAEEAASGLSIEELAVRYAEATLAALDEGGKP